MSNYLIDFKNEIGEEEIQSYFQENQCSQIKVFNRLDNTYYVRAETQPPLTSIVTTVVNDDDSHLQPLTVVEFPLIVPTGTATINSTDEHNWWKLYSLNGIDLDQNEITVSKFGRGVNVYLVDSGIDIAHTEFTNRDINLLFSFTGEFSDNNGHGTALSSLLIGNTCGITDSSLKVVKIFDQNIPTRQSDLLNSFDAILEDAEVSSNKVSVVNLSWGIPKNSFIESKIQCLINAGLIIVVSSGNSGIPISDVTPASMSGVLTIGSYGQNFLPSDFSNYTNSAIDCTPNLNNFGELDSWAPGDNIYIAVVGNNGYSLASGTSLSAAIYSGSMAYNMSQYLTSTGELPQAFKMTDGSGIVNISEISYFDRKGLLDLSDIKYASSVNKICSYRDIFGIPSVDEMQLLEQTVRLLAHPGKFTSRKWIYSNSAQSYEVLGDLPNGITFDGTFINVAIQTEPVSEQHVDHHIIPIKINLRDSDTFITKNIEVILIGALFDPAGLDPSDPILTLTLDVSCKSFGSNTLPPCWRHYCVNTAYTCVTIGKVCSCVGG